MKIWFAFASFLIITGCAGFELPTAEEMKHEYVLKEDNMPKEKIFDGVIEWIAVKFVSAKSVLDYYDRNAGTIVAKGIFSWSDNQYSSSTYGEVQGKFTLLVRISDNTAKFSFTDLAEITKPDSWSWWYGVNTRKVNLAGKQIFTRWVDQIDQYVKTR